MHLVSVHGLGDVLVAAELALEAGKVGQADETFDGPLCQ